MSTIQSTYVLITETPRDAFQGWGTVIPTARKVAYINKLLEAGFHTVDAGSIVSENAVPQMADTMQVIGQLNVVNSTSSLMVLTAGTRYATRAVEQPVIRELAYPHSVSETFLHRNIRSNIRQSRDNVIAINKICHNHNKKFRVYLSMAFGNPYYDPWSEDLILSEVDKLLTMGINRIGFSDITGEATSETIFKLGTRLVQHFGNKLFTIHLHTLPQERSEKITAAWQSGFVHFETSLGGFGGCPMSGYDLVGNLDTLALLDWCDNHSVKYSVSKPVLLKALILHPMGTSGLRNKA